MSKIINLVRGPDAESIAIRMRLKHTVNRLLTREDLVKESIVVLNDHLTIWPDGSPRSSDNDFNWRNPPRAYESPQWSPKYLGPKRSE